MSERRSAYRATIQAGDTLTAADPYFLAMTLPYPPSVNRLYRSLPASSVDPKTGRARHFARAVKSREGREYFALVADTVAKTLIIRGGVRPRAPLRLTIELYPPDRRLRDVDGPVKAGMDALFAGLGMDDSAVAELHVYRRAPDTRNPRAEVLLEAAGPAVEQERQLGLVAD